MAKFEDAVLEALATLPKGYCQRIDGLMTESVVMKTYPQWFPRIRLWLLERRGKIVNQRSNHSFWPSQNGLKVYQLPQSA